MCSSLIVHATNICSFRLNFQSSLFDKTGSGGFIIFFIFWIWFWPHSLEVWILNMIQKCDSHRLLYAFDTLFNALCFLNPSQIRANSNGFRCYLLHSVTVVINLKGLQPPILQPCWYLSLIFIKVLNLNLCHVREGVKKNDPFSSLLLLRGPATPPPLVVPWAIKILGPYFFGKWIYDCQNKFYTWSH